MRLEHAMCPPRLRAEKGWSKRAYYRSYRTYRTYGLHRIFDSLYDSAKPIHEEKDHEFPEA